MNFERVLKSLIKVGLKIAEPFGFGALLLAIEEVSGLSLDHLTETKRNNLEARLLEKMKIKLSSLDCSKDFQNIEESNLLQLFEVTKEILTNHFLNSEEWVGLDFDPSKGTDAVLAKAKIIFDPLSSAQKYQCRLLIEAYHAAFLDDRDALRQTEAQFRRSVLECIRDLPNRIKSLSSVQAHETFRVAAAALIHLPQRSWNPEISSPGMLLRADFECAVPFHGRHSEIDDMDAWCTSERRIGIRLYTAPGGMGKTRLFLEVCKRLADKGWRAGFLHSEASNSPNEIWAEIFQSKPIFLVIDYAETRLHEVFALGRQLNRNGHGGKIRIVLIARAAGDWWDGLMKEGDGVGEIFSGPATATCSLGPVAMTLAERQESFDRAVGTFSKILKAPVPIFTPQALEAQHFERVLMIHMSALATIDGVKIRNERGDQGILDYILQRERRFWSIRAKVAGVSGALERAIGQTMAVISLSGGAENEKEALSLLTNIPLLKDQPILVHTIIVRILHDTYPGEKWIEPILPDLLGEHLVQVELGKDTNELLDLVLGSKD